MYRRKRHGKKHLRRALLISAAVHMLLVLVRPPKPPEPEPDVIEVTMLTPSKEITKQPTPKRAPGTGSPVVRQKRRNRSKLARRARRNVAKKSAAPKKARKRRASSKQPSNKPAQKPSPLLRMRAPSLRLQHDPFGTVASRAKVRNRAGYVQRTYGDGSQTLTRDTSLGPLKAPPKGLTREHALAAATRRTLRGLSGLAGAGEGGFVCDHFSKHPSRTARRHVYVLVDRSGSMTQGNAMTASELCAGGIALSALRAGHAVAIMRFADTTTCATPSLRRQTIMGMMQALKGANGATSVPSSCVDRSKGPADIVIISDGGFNGSMTSALHRHKKLLSLKGNRGFMYLIRPGFAPRRYVPEAAKAFGKAGYGFADAFGDGIRF